MKRRSRNLFTSLFVSASAVFLQADYVRADPRAVYQAVGERLGWMQAVAAWKFANQVDIEDLEREAVVLAAAEKAALQHGLSPESAKDFFQSQINAAKEIQFCWTQRWKNGEALPGKIHDLGDEIRPELIRLGGVILTELARELEENGALHAESKPLYLAETQMDCLGYSGQSELFTALTQVAQKTE